MPVPLLPSRWKPVRSRREGKAIFLFGPAVVGVVDGVGENLRLLFPNMEGMDGSA